MTAVMDPSMKIMFRNALTDLYTGDISQIDREVLAYSPLPSDIVDPYAAQDVDPVNSMNLTYSAMTAWIEEAKKANYFSKHFVTLSKMIMNGTTTMVRGLVTLHQRGESIEEAPMSIGDLISLSSYHFRKSYLGVMQTMKTHPEISERLLLNQLGWCNTLMRLYKTKEKLAQQVSVSGCQASEALQDPGPRVQDPETAAIEALPASKQRGIDAASAFAEPGAFSAPRAFSSYDHSNSGKQSLRSLTASDNHQKLSAGTDGHQAAKSEKGSRDQVSEFTRTDSPESPENPDTEPENGSIMKIQPSETNKHENIQREDVEEITTPEKPECPKDGAQKSPDEDPAERSEIKLTDAEKQILNRVRRNPDKIYQMQANVSDPVFTEDFPRLTAAYRNILAFLDSS